MKRMYIWASLLPALFLWVGCSDNSGPEPGQTIGPAQLHIARQNTAAPPLQTYSASFWAVRGTSRTLEIDYVGGEDFFRLDVPGDGLLRRPDGSLIAQGDSVLITVQIDPALLLARFEPSGLQFDPAHPATLRIEYERADDDFNEDGVVDGDDDAIEQVQLGMWRQEAAGASWVRLATVRSATVEDFRADLLQFSNYALGW